MYKDAFLSPSLSIVTLHAFPSTPTKKVRNADRLPPSTTREVKWMVGDIVAGVGMQNWVPPPPC